MIKIFSFASAHPVEFAFCIFLAAIPSIVWISIFNRKHHEKKSLIAWNFLLGIGSAFIVLLYQYFWGQKFNLGFFAVEPLNFQQNIHSAFSHPILISALVFLSVGFLEEYSKHWVVKSGDKKLFKSVDDVVEFSIIAALGFSFLENIGYFFQMILIGQQKSLLGLFIMRSIFVVFTHVLCSGIYGYFYGLGFFSKPIYDDEKSRGHKLFVPHLLHKVFHFSEERTFHNEMISLGLVSSILLHGLYDFILDVNLSVGQILGIASLNELYLHTIFLPAFFVFSFWVLSKILKSSENQKVFGQKIVSESFS